MKDNSSRRLLVMVGFYVLGVIALVFWGTILYGVFLQNQQLVVPYDEAVRLSKMEGKLTFLIQFEGAIFLLLFVAQAVLFIVWEYRSYRNLMELNLNTRFKPGWTIWGWILPLVNSVMPGLVLLDLVRQHENLLKFFGKLGGLPSPKLLRGLLWSWWGVLLLTNLLNYTAEYFLKGSMADNRTPILVSFSVLYFIMHIGLMEFTRRIGKWERASLNLWTSGAIEDFKSKNKPVDFQKTAEWYKEGEQEFKPELDGFVDQKNDQAD